MSIKTESKQRSVWQYAKQLWIINRFEALFAYNIGYFSILTTGALAFGAELEQLWLLVPLFGAVIFMKSQASVADALHDYDADKQNSEKEYVAQSVDYLGEDYARTFLFLQVLASFLFWGYLTVYTNNIFYLVAGIVSNFFGYTYSYPPRFKERNIFNHIVTSGVDVACIFLPGFVLLTGKAPATFYDTVGIIFFYSLAFHIMHQAGDTYQDRQSSISTFTQYVGVDRAVGISALLLLVSSVIAIHARLALIAAGGATYAIYFLALYYRTYVESEKEQSLSVSRSFKISRCATSLNFLLAVDFLAIVFL